MGVRQTGPQKQRAVGAVLPGSGLGFVTPTDGELFAVNKGGHRRRESVCLCDTEPVAQETSLPRAVRWPGCSPQSWCLCPPSRWVVTGRGAESQGLKACLGKLLYRAEQTRVRACVRAHSSRLSQLFPSLGPHQHSFQ